MNATLQTESESTEVSLREDNSNTLYAIIGILLVMVLIWVTVKGKLRDWFMK